MHVLMRIFRRIRTMYASHLDGLMDEFDALMKEFGRTDLSDEFDALMKELDLSDELDKAHVSAMPVIVALQEVFKKDIGTVSINRGEDPRA